MIELWAHIGRDCAQQHLDMLQELAVKVVGYLHSEAAKVIPPVDLLQELAEVKAVGYLCVDAAKEALVPLRAPALQTTKVFLKLIVTWTVKVKPNLSLKAWQA